MKGAFTIDLEKAKKILRLGLDEPNSILIVSGMTEHSLERGREIQNEISTLKAALSDIDRSCFFKIESSVGCCTRQGDPFLSVLQSSLKTQAVEAIASKIEALQNEFEKL